MRPAHLRLGVYFLNNVYEQISLRNFGRNIIAKILNRQKITEVLDQRVLFKLCRRLTPRLLAEQVFVLQIL